MFSERQNRKVIYHPALRKQTFTGCSAQCTVRRGKSCSGDAVWPLLYIPYTPHQNHVLRDMKGRGTNAYGIHTVGSECEPTRFKARVCHRGTHSHLGLVGPIPLLSVHTEAQKAPFPVSETTASVIAVVESSIISLKDLK